MSSDLTIAKELLSPPGDTLQETLDEIGMPQKELAERMGVHLKTINSIIKGKGIISMDTALNLERVLGIPSSFWLNREREYRDELAKIEEQEFLEKRLDWLKLFPLAQMKKNGWISESKRSPALVNEMLKFFGIAKPEQWNRIYTEEQTSVAFRISLAHVNNAGAISVWLRKGQLDAGKIKLKSFTKNQFRKALKTIRELAYKHPKDFKKKLQDVCASVGVAVVYVPNLPKAPISGAARWIYDKPVIQLSGRYKSNDHFWFTFFHEAGHILLHGKKDIFLEGLDTNSMDELKEDEANNFASDFLIPKNVLKQLMNEEIDDEIINEYSKKYHIHKGIIVGQLQHKGVIPHNKFNEYKVKIDLFNF